jgi:hypothetical protein
MSVLSTTSFLFSRSSFLNLAHISAVNAFDRYGPKRHAVAISRGVTSNMRRRSA